MNREKGDSAVGRLPSGWHLGRGVVSEKGSVSDRRAWEYALTAGTFFWIDLPSQMDLPRTGNLA